MPGDLSPPSFSTRKTPAVGLVPGPRLRKTPEIGSAARSRLRKSPDGRSRAIFGRGGPGPRDLPCGQRPRKHWNNSWVQKRSKKAHAI